MSLSIHLKLNLGHPIINLGLVEPERDNCFFKTLNFAQSTNSLSASLSPLEKMQSISAAHSAIRNGFNRPQFDAYRREHETLFKEITQKGVRR